MSAIEKMVVWLEQDGKDLVDENNKIMSAQYLRKARSLLAEEAAQKSPLMSMDTATGEIKPTAPASLVEEFTIYNNTVIRNVDSEMWRQVDSILSRYTPTSSIAGEPPADLWEQHKAMIKLAQDHGLHLAANWAVNMSGKTFSGEATLPDREAK